MNICFFETAQNLGGARIAAISMAKNLSDHHNVCIMDLYGSCEPFVKACNDSGIKFSVLAPEQDPHFIRSASNFVQKLKGVLTFIPHLMKMGKIVKKHTDAFDANYICVSDFRPLLMFLLVKPRGKVVFFAHGWYIKSQLSFFSRYLLHKRADKIVCISEATKQAIFNCGIAPLENLYVVHNSISLEKVLTTPAVIDNASDKTVIMHCGGFTKGKGQLISLGIAKELKRQGVRFKLVFAGILYQGNESSKYLESLKEYVSSNDLNDDVLFIVGKNNVYDYMNSCDILIHPSETEGFPLVVMEAQMLGKPVVANSVGGVIDMILNGFTGFLPTHNSIDEYCSIIKSLISDKDLYDYISKNSRDLATRCFSNSQQIKDLERVFC